MFDLMSGKGFGEEKKPNVAVNSINIKAKYKAVLSMVLFFLESKFDNEESNFNRHMIFTFTTNVDQNNPQECNLERNKHTRTKGPC
mmetsp:Transcript_16632/g.21583  ORF Transcript_16632/g.21583 Transcript_16632/m.21583 type:complete len:86 (-) Transcript_16632:15-272(-)